ncbi:MAG: alpha/beta hydrolase [Acidobacteria bacterium]|nr:alpha/beta hydrolase [Acidobacteriota bacterium]NIM60880.1 alpha/beta hydrolase [Acidobacteriota bacterium]NIO60414.1 alpha/beta hydrolase [Acidobacteriota bacterium]NIQ31509.1 alpha/beta hydrolase [Acidobacteriota bacterium]NIQ86745.1 alpha/beta hydrolase [Acidobacteriota bacterium]
MNVVEGRFDVSERAGSVSSLSLAPERALALLVMGHGAGAGMRHRGMERLAVALAAQSIATFRYQFPYMEQGRRFPDPLPLRLATVGAALEAAAELHPELPLLAGGRSMGGRMSSTWVSENPGSALIGLVFFAFPLHPPGKPGTARARHLNDLDVPMLFLQGTRDNLAELALIELACGALGARAQLHILEGADHSFLVPKRSGRTDQEVLDEAARATRRFVERRLRQ